ncbi:hypothetical protein MMC27_002047 [Xylographa pallens]|nr:hypothetical protein [Xylographa pallens]
MSSYLITGCSRGLGLALVTRLSTLPESEVSLVIATARGTPSAELQKLSDHSSGRISIIELEDVTDETSVKGAVKEAREVLRLKRKQGLDILINNAGVICRNTGNIETMLVL